MIMSGLVAFSAPVIANEQVTFPVPPDASGETYTLLWNNDNMVDHPEWNAQDEKIVINVAGTANRLIYLGDDTMDAAMPKLQFQVQQVNDPGQDVTFTVVSGNQMITVGDDDGGVWNTGAGWPATATAIDFDIIVNNVGDVERAYDMTLRISEAFTPAVVRNLPFQIYISSVFHRTGTELQEDTPHKFTLEAGASDYVRDATVLGTGDAPFEAGDEFKPAVVTFQNRAAFAVKNPQINLTAPTTTPANQIELVGETYAKFVGTVAAAGNVGLNWRVDVAARTLPGVYTGTAIVHYTTTVVGVEKNIRENVRNIDYTVDYNFKDTHPYTPGTETLWSEFQCYATNVEIIEDETRQIDYSTEGIYDIPTIEQDTYTDRKIKVNVTIVNNGNSDLYNLELEIQPGDSTSGWTFFRNPRFFWPSATGAVAYDSISDTDQPKIILLMER